MKKSDEKKVSSAELVIFTEEDPEDPVNWSGLKKKGVVAILCMLSFVS
jgi:hypothetical protein